MRLSNEGGPDGKPKEILPDVLPTEYFEAFHRICKDPNHQLMVVECQVCVAGTFHLTYITYIAGKGQEDCQIEAVHVDAACRNKGIGTQMMQWAIAQARQRDCRRLQLTTNKHRKDVHRFYERLGFSLSHEGAKLILSHSHGASGYSEFQRTTYGGQPTIMFVQGNQNE